jgi:glucose/arabinose dehydrogenase
MRTRPLLRPATALFLLTLVAPPTLLAEPAAAAPAAEVSITPVVTGLEIPWDVTWVGDLMLFDERAGRLWSMRPGAEPQRVDLPLPPLWNRS